MDKAWAYLTKPNRSKEDLEAALRILSNPEIELNNLDSSLRQRIYWGLMAVEKELSCYIRFPTSEKMTHISKARTYWIEVERIVSQSPNPSLEAQVTLERHIIQGRKAQLDFKMTKDVHKWKKLKSEAIAGIDASLGRLHEVDRKSYDKVSEAAKEWRIKFSC